MKKSCLLVPSVETKIFGRKVYKTCFARGGNIISEICEQQYENCDNISLFDNVRQLRETGLYNIIYRFIAL